MHKKFKLRVTREDRWLCGGETGGKTVFSFPWSLKPPLFMKINLTANIIPISSGGSSRALLVGALGVRNLTFPEYALGDQVDPLDPHLIQ